MCRRLDRALPELRFPEGVDVRTFQANDAPAVHALLVEAYRHGGGSVAAYASWQRDFTGDVEFSAESCFLAFAGEQLVGVALCWDSGFAKDIVVAEEFRRRGIASALLSRVLHHFVGLGLTVVRLKVEAGNPSGAERVYQRLGFERE